MSLDIDPGEILALVGENGAGKSTLMNVLAGLYQPDAGEILINNERVRLSSPKDAFAKGIGMVHQHFTLVPSLTVAENVVLGQEPTRHGLLDQTAAHQQVEATCRRFGFRLTPGARVANLTVGSQQKLEILKVLHRGAQTVILDEPTAVLTPQEIDDLFRMMRQLAQAGQTLVFIAHKLKEVLAVADQIAVMGRGRVVAKVKASEATEKDLAHLMIGEGPGFITPKTTQLQRGPVLLQTKDLQATDDEGRPAVRGVSIQVFAGEIVGIAGVDGNGQRELAEVITGLRHPSSGSAEVLSEPLSHSSPRRLRERGLAHVPEDRWARAIIAPMTVEENISLGRQNQPPFASGARIDFAQRRARARKLMAEFDVRPPEPALPIAHLSGGNQQKVVVARELDAQPKLLVVVQPTRGLDIAAVATVHQHLLDERQRGTGVLLISLDLEELMTLSDRICVMLQGRVVGEVARGAFDEREIGRLMLSGGNDSSPAVEHRSGA